MTTKYFDNRSSVLSSTEIRVYEDYLDAPPISGVYVFEVEKGRVKCGMSGNVEKRFSKLAKIKKCLEEPREGRVAVLPVDEERLKRAEEAFFALLSGNVEGTKTFKTSFEIALKALRKLCENNPPSMFHLTDEEKAEKELRKQKAEKATKKSSEPWDKALIRNRYAYNRVVAELGVSKIFTLCLRVFPLSVDEVSLERFMGEYRHCLYLVDILLSRGVWEEDYGMLNLDDVTAGRIGVLALRLHGVTYSYKDVLKSPVHPRRVVYHAANLVAILEDIKNLYSELIEVAEKSGEKYPELVFKDARDRAGYFIRYVIDLFIVTCACPGQDVSQFSDELQSVCERLEELNKEDALRE